MAANVASVVEYYRSVVESLGYIVRDNRVRLVTAEGEEDAIIDGKNLVLPDDTFLRNPNWERDFPFHPLCEVPQRGESILIKNIVETVQANLNISLLGLLVRLYSDVVCIDDSTRLSTEQSFIMTALPAPTTQIKKAIIGMISHDPELINMILRRRCVLKDVSYDRVCVVRFPLADMTRRDEPYGIKTAAAFDTLRGLMDVVVPGWEEDDQYSCGTNTFVAPYFTSVMLTYAKLGSRINEVIDLFSNVCPKLESYRIHGADRVVEMIERPGYMESLRDVIPALGEGNRGGIEPTNVVQAQHAGATNQQTTVQPPHVNGYPKPQEETAPTRTANLGQDTVAVPYVPGSLTPSAPMMQVGIQQPNMYGMVNQQVMVQQNNAMANVDPNSIHGRHLQRMALMQPLAMQGSTVLGNSPFLASNEVPQQPRTATPYVPGSLTGINVNMPASTALPLVRG